MTKKTTASNPKLMVQRTNLVEKTIDIPIDDIQFPTNNPRIAQHGQNLSQDEIQKIIFGSRVIRLLKNGEKSFQVLLQ